VGPVEILSERGNMAKVANPWGNGKVTVLRLRDQQAIPVQYASDTFEFPTEPNQQYRVAPLP
jgi:hypothetical protein